MTGGIETVFVGSIVHAKSLTELEVLENGILGLIAEGKIAFLQSVEGNRGDVSDEVLRNASQTHGFDFSAVRRLKTSQFLLPGLVSIDWGSCTDTATVLRHADRSDRLIPTSTPHNTSSPEPAATFPSSNGSKNTPSPANKNSQTLPTHNPHITEPSPALSATEQPQPHTMLQFTQKQQRS